MRIVLLVLAALDAPVLGLGLAAGPSWLFWPACILAVLLLCAVGAQWLSSRSPSRAWLAPLALMVVVVAIASSDATSWILWSVAAAALLASATGLREIERRKSSGYV